MRRAQEITDQAFREILNFIRPGMTEQQVAARLVYEMLRRGARKVSFDPIVAAGANGSMPHAVPGETVIQAGMFVTMDFGCIWDGYCSDMTRTVAVGQPTEEMEKVLFAADELTGLIGAAALMRPSKSCQDMEVSSLKKKFKDKKFAAGCSRDVIKTGAERLGWTLEELMEKTLQAQRSCEESVAAQMAAL